ncbi:MAG: PIN domain-containing protein [Limisphaerales bacterium]
MPKLLKGDRVFIDTQVFRKSRFGVADPKFTRFRELCADGELVLVTTSITRREIEAQIDEVVPEIISAFTKASHFAACLGQPVLTILGMPASDLTEPVVAAALKKSVDGFFQGCATVQLEFPKDKLSDVLDSYFERRPPFGAGKKKAEFPDAFVLETLKARPGSKGEVTYVITEDPDFVEACKHCAQLESVPTLGHFLDRYNVHAEGVKQVRATLRKNAKQIDKKLQEIVDGLSVELDCAGKVETSRREIVDILDTLVISCDEGKASVEFVCWVKFDAWIEIRPESDAPSEFQQADTERTINITLEFRFDPTDPNVFQVESYWSPQSVMFSGHRRLY